MASKDRSTPGQARDQLSVAYRAARHAEIVVSRLPHGARSGFPPLRRFVGWNRRSAVTIHGNLRMTSQSSRCPIQLAHARQLDEVAVHIGKLLQRFQIGRASCREGVEQ